MGASGGGESIAMLLFLKLLVVCLLWPECFMVYNLRLKVPVAGLALRFNRPPLLLDFNSWRCADFWLSFLFLLFFFLLFNFLKAILTKLVNDHLICFIHHFAQLLLQFFKVLVLSWLIKHGLDALLSFRAGLLEESLLLLFFSLLSVRLLPVRQKVRRPDWSFL